MGFYVLCLVCGWSKVHFEAAYWRYSRLHKGLTLWLNIDATTDLRLEYFWLNLSALMGCQSGWIFKLIIHADLWAGFEATISAPS